MFKTVNDVLKGVEKTDKSLGSGHVSVQDASSGVAAINKTYDDFAANVKEAGIDLKDYAVNNPLIGQEMFDAFGGVKNGAVTGMQGVASYFTAVDTFKGNWGNPEVARQKIETGLKAIVIGTKNAGKCLQSLARSGSAIGTKLKSISSPMKSGVITHPLINKLGGGVIAASGGMNTLGGGMVKMGDELNPEGAGRFKDVIPLAGNVTFGISSIANKGIVTGGAASFPASMVNKNTQQSQNKQSSDSEAEYVAELKFILEGGASEKNSECKIDGIDYLISGYTLSQNMLSPVMLSFLMMKKADAEETDKDVTYDVCRHLMGKAVELQVMTKTIAKDTDASKFVFKGLITGVTASRGSAGAPSINVTASTYEYLLDAAPNCRSFENKTLAEIVNKVIAPYKQIEAHINPRYKERIPYIVQYNQSDYAFLMLLARRFGEWMYNTGTMFVFGELVAPSETVVKMRYPSGNVFGYGIDLQLRDFTFTHVTNDLYDNDIKSKTGDGEADKELHIINEAAYKTSKELFTVQDIYHLGTGGVFDDGASEKTDDILTFSTKVEARGKKAQMFVTNGSSKVAKLFLGQTFEIEDGVENRSGEKKDIQQRPLMVLGVSHCFDLKQEYSNTFEAIPSSCDYPPYSTADVFAVAYPQRAIVVDNQDPQYLGRVRVQFPWQKIQDNGEEKMWTPWIRIAQAYGGLSKGVQFIPEEGEEVMVGFEMDNIERPYIIGTLFNGKGNPDNDWKSKVSEGTANNIKAIRTRSGHTIQFCDNGGGGDIQIYDYNKNYYFIQLSTDEKCIRIHAAGNIEVVAGNDITIKAQKNITIEAGENISMQSGKDTDISADANVSIEAENNMQQEATDIFVKAENSISQESGNSHIIKTEKLQEKAGGTASIDGGSLLEMTAGKVKVR